MGLWVLGSVLMVLALLSVLAVVSLDEQPDDVPSGPSGPVTPGELRAFDGRIVTRGYDPGRVDALLERAARTIEELSARDGGRAPTASTSTPDGDVS